MQPAVLAADAHWLIVDKPAGLLAVPGRGTDKQDCLLHRLWPQWPDALVVHRLDQATSGLMVFARSAVAQRSLSRAFAQRQVDKHYVAVVAGTVVADEGRIDLPLAADWPRRPLQKVDTTGGKPSLTCWRVLARDAVAGRSRLELRPLTGRTHQLRVHLQAIGHPILGDGLYAPPPVQAAAPRLLLHACALSLAHPQSGEMHGFESAAPF